MTDSERFETAQKASTTSAKEMPPLPPSKPSLLRSSSSETLPTKANSITPGPLASPPLPPKPLPFRDTPIAENIKRKPAPPPPPPPRLRRSSPSGPNVPTDPSPLSQAQTAPTPESKDDPIDRQGYRASVRDKVSSVYNSLPSLYSASPSQPVTSASNNHQALSDSHDKTSDSPLSLTSKRPPPVPPRRNLTSQPAAAAHYATNRLSGGWSGYNTDKSLEDSNGNPISKKEEMWLQRWGKAKAILSQKGVVLRTWRVGADVLNEAVRLVEKANREDQAAKERNR
ncbi:MAG: hypothetical protein Q9190_003596 [Brigantiaea leucoxantha]